MPTYLTNLLIIELNLQCYLFYWDFKRSSSLDSNRIVNPVAVNAFFELITDDACCMSC